MEFNDARCEVCGTPADLRRLTLTASKSEPVHILCDLCQGLIDSGLIREEIDEAGDRVYRQWHIQPMTPGPLLPKVAAQRER